MTIKSAHLNRKTPGLWSGLVAGTLVSTSVTLAAAQPATTAAPDPTTTQPTATEEPPAPVQPAATEAAVEPVVQSEALATNSTVAVSPQTDAPKATAAETEEVAPEEPVPSRSDRMFALTGSMGWNSLAGFALGGTFNIGPHVSADIAAGLAAIGLKTGLRVRYNLFKSNWTPTFGMGFQYGPGSGGQPVDVDGQDGPASLVVERSGFVQALAGMSYQGRSGFTALFGAGYSVLLDDDNIRVVSGSEETADLTRFVTGNGIVIEIALGYAF